MRNIILWAGLLLLGWVDEKLQFCQGSSSSTAGRLINMLLKDYHPDMRPSRYLHEGVNVSFGVAIRKIHEVDEVKEIVKCSLWVRQRWKNYFLRWNSSEWENLKRITLTSNLVWVPDITLYNAAGDRFSGGRGKYQTKVVLYSDGTNEWNSPAHYSTSCKINIKYFPFDEQRCYFEFGSWAYDQSAIDMYPRPHQQILGDFVIGTEWKLHSPVVKRKAIKYDCCNRPFVTLQFFITLQRNSLYYTFTLIIPCLLLLPLATVGFVAPPECGERVGLTIAVLLALAVILQVTSQTVPRYSDSIPIIKVFFMSMMGTTSMSLLLNATVLMVHFKGECEIASPLPRWVKRLLFGHVLKILCMKDAAIWYAYDQNCKSNSLVYKNMKVSLKKRAEREQTVLQLVHQVRRDELTEVISGKLENGLSCDESVRTWYIKHIQDNVTLIRSHCKDVTKIRKLHNEWKLAAAVLNRIILICYIITAICMPCSLLIQLYWN